MTWAPTPPPNEYDQPPWIYIQRRQGSRRRRRRRLYKPSPLSLYLSPQNYNVILVYTYSSVQEGERNSLCPFRPTSPDLSFSLSRRPLCLSSMSSLSLSNNTTCTNQMHYLPNVSLCALPNAQQFRSLRGVTLRRTDSPSLFFLNFYPTTFSRLVHSLRLISGHFQNPPLYLPTSTLLLQPIVIRFFPQYPKCKTGYLITIFSFLFVHFRTFEALKNSCDTRCTFHVKFSSSLNIFITLHNI